MSLVCTVGYTWTDGEVMTATKLNSAALPTIADGQNGVFGTITGTAGGSIVALSTLSIRDTSAAYDVTIAATSSTALTAGRTLTIDLVNASRTLKLNGNSTLNQDVSTTASPTFVGGTFSGSFSASANDNFGVGPGGTSNGQGIININSGSASGGGGGLRFRRNANADGYIGNDSWIQGGTTADIGLYSVAGSVKVYSNNSLSLTLDTSNNATFAGTISTTLGSAWDLGAANSVSPTSPNRTLTVKIGGSTYYIAAKTTND